MTIAYDQKHPTFIVMQKKFLHIWVYVASFILHIFYVCNVLVLFEYLSGTGRDKYHGNFWWASNQNIKQETQSHVLRQRGAEMIDLKENEVISQKKTSLTKKLSTENSTEEFKALVLKKCEIKNQQNNNTNKSLLHLGPSKFSI